MGKFGKYGGGNPLLPSRDKTSQDITPANRVAAEIEKASRSSSRSEQADRLVFGDVAHVAIALDATGSMAGLLRMTKDALAEIIARASREASRPIEIELFVYRDYDVPRNLIERSGRSTDPQQLKGWLAGVQAMGGGGNDGEAVEAALQKIVEDGNFGVVLLAGDEPSNSASSVARGGRNAVTAHDLAAHLGRQQVPIHSFVVGDDPRTVADFRRLSQASGGQSGRMDGSREMIDLAVMAILAKLKGAAGVRKYVEATQLTDNSRAFAQLLLGKST